MPKGLCFKSTKHCVIVMIRQEDEERTGAIEAVVRLVATDAVDVVVDALRHSYRDLHNYITVTGQRDTVLGIQQGF